MVGVALATFAHGASQVPFPLPDVPIHEAGQAAQFVNGKVLPPRQTNAVIDLRKYRGKPLIVAFITLGCGHCVTTVQYLIQLQDQYGSKGLQVVGVAGSDHADIDLPQWLQRFRPNFPFGYLTQDPLLKLTGLSPDARPFVPILLFVDPNGTVRERKFGNDPDMKTETVNTALLNATRALMASSAPIFKK